MYNVYVVKENDTFDSIAKKFNIPFFEIIKNNNLENMRELDVGQELKIPVDYTGLLQLYRVKRGDTVNGIANKFNIEATSLLMINGLSNNAYIYQNQDILIPKENVSIYITKPEDSLDSILNSRSITLEQLLTFNEKLYLVPNQIIMYRN